MEVTLESLELIEELAYTAGIVDGEGSVGIGHNEKSSKNLYYGVFVSVTNTAEWLTQWLQLTHGGSVHPYQHPNPKYKLAYKWSLHGVAAAEFLESILPYLHLKRPQAELAIKFQKQKKLHANHHILYDQRELVLQEADYILMASLNKRGL